MRVVLHIGLPKTGSTTVQRFLVANAAALAAQSVAYPVDSGPLAPPKQTWIAEACKRDPARITALAEAHRDANTLILSNEYHVYLRRKLVARLRKALTDGGASEFHVVLYVRNLADRLLSLCNQLAKSKTALYSETLQAETARLPIGEALENWEAVFGPDTVDVRLLEKAEDLERDFCQAAGIAWSADFQAAPPANASLDPITAQLLAMLRMQFDIPMIAYTLLPGTVRLPKLDNRYLAEIAEVVRATDLSHPKLARFEPQLRALRYRDEDSAPALASYLDELAGSIEALRAGLSPTASA